LNSKPDGVALDLIVASATACVLPSRALAELRPQDVEALLTLPSETLYAPAAPLWDDLVVIKVFHSYL
tara:strand:- start:352 stop:555 length:204 start_codon:yes stop_codon:yes gene_type:complete